MSPSALVICRACGVVAPPRASACEACARPLAETRVAAPQMPEGSHWAAVRCGFVCNSCRFLAPLDAIDADGAVECAHCGLRQRFDVEQWRDGLGFARDVSDLAGPSPEGRSPNPDVWIGDDNPYRDVGAAHTFARADHGSLMVSAAPGHPVCRGCAEPLHVEIGRDGVAKTRCARCQAAGTYELSPEAFGLGAAVAAVADAHRTDRPKAVVARQGSVVTLTCPQCNAPLSPVPGSALQTCRFCNTSSIVTEASLHRALQRDVEPATFWVLFPRGSAKRDALENPTSAEDEAEIRAQKIGILKSKRVEIGDAPGVYEAPEVEGPPAAQYLVTSIVGSAALLLGLLLARVFGLLG